MPRSKQVRAFFKDTAYYIVGSIFFSVGLYTFALNGNFAPGGVSGLALIVTHFTGFPVGITTLILNIPLILVSVRVIGIPFFVKSLWTMVIQTIFLDVVFPHIPTYDSATNPLLAALFTGVFLGAGLAIIYMRGSSTGGIDFLTMSIKKKRPYLSVGRITLALDLAVILLGGVAFQNIDSILYGILASFGCSIVIDNLLYGSGGSKLAIIITNHGKDIAASIASEVDRGSTLVQGTGTFTGHTRDMLFCACSKREIYKVRTAAHATDPEALIMVTDATDVIGEGFIPPPIPGSEVPKEILEKTQAGKASK